ncbi:LysR substrate-binding domain-containing protein [Sphingosinicella sp. LHD-64]|uniref:LysR substrate-binding domain-containing protein n=1 Tax=Sphingosinicella sp. LHD-64 TaxID=3072139 RepID=UPI00280E7317|nr:LysR substrate-binding domain-containing protein [Sphingosinicella sp. LHD-64]MDQ8757420.1 LysR substrate-binding domain-containing protein [Sphingosinicella sp. LHD-64]
MDLWQLNLRHLGAAAAIYRLGSVSAAADAVSLSQPAITQALGKLEAQLGLPLFERRPGGMEPTEAARLITQRVEAALAHIASPRVTMAQLRALIAFADAGKYSGASAATGLAPPSLHRSVKDLSVALRRPMTERRGKGLALTEQGRRTVRAFRLARAELQAGLAEIWTLKGREIGRIAIGAMPLSRARLLPAAVVAFHRVHPEIVISIAEGSRAELLEPLRDGDLDLLIGALRDPLPGEDIEEEPMFEDRPVILGRKGHPLAGSNPGVRDLARYPWTVAAKGVPLRAQWERMFTDAQVPVPEVPVECGSVITIRQILLDSDFLTLLSPDQVAVELEANWLDIICDAPEGLVRSIGVITRANWRPTALQAAFVAQLKAIAGI